MKRKTDNLVPEFFEKISWKIFEDKTSEPQGQHDFLTLIFLLLSSQLSLPGVRRCIPYKLSARTMAHNIKQGMMQELLTGLGRMV